MLAELLDVDNSVYAEHKGYFYNIKKATDSKWSRLILFMGEGGTFLQIGFEDVIYVGGFTGSKYNKRVGLFSAK